ncbi:MAG: flavin reductase family protein [Candidatus Omnitrophota bacterium]
MRNELSLDLATRLVNHSPVLLVSSLYAGKTDLTPVAWHMPVSKDPPVIALEIGENHHIYKCIMETGDFVVNILSKDYTGQIVKCGSCSGRDVDKTEICGFSLEASRFVRSYSLKEAAAVLECVLIRDEHLLREYNMVPAEIKYAEVCEGFFSGHWLFDKRGFKTIHHLGDGTFCAPDMVFGGAG